ncbi:MAG: energy-coupling factor ABC transporter permease [Accumulibacter sp.]|jgi:uncharacterized membrane protein|uniref:energy-coupling factor ABC transporter permease n=1 Tax=Accumulibacter sp. TaxID=2053492 RepID=UPI002FC30D06
MNLPDGLLDTGWVMVAWTLFVGATVIAARRAPWRVLLDSSRLNAFLAMIVALILLWQLQAGVKPGLSLHLLGATVFTLCFGWQLAFLGLSVVLLGVTLNGAAGWQAFALNAVLMAGVGVGVSHTAHRLVDRLLPGHLFVFIFCKGFFTAALAVLAVGLVSSLVFALAGAYSGQYLADDYLPYFFLLGFSEAWLSGMLSTLLAVYRPQLLADGSDAPFPGGK